ncbi:MAG: hypothetical protein N2109_06390 [Fimbriimonadales bacterium]|nr:hypothetical protein [Fimbriimonadales bacterium]
MIIPAVHRKLAFRLIGGLFAIALLFFGYQWIRGFGQDPGDVGKAETAGWIVALRLRDSGAQVVAIRPDGTVVESPGYTEGKNDREPVWRPGGNQVFFTSDRESDAYNLFRWNLGLNLVERRSQGTRSQLQPVFSPPELGAGTDTALVLAGGFVLEFKPREGTTHQVLPPVGREIAQTESDDAHGAASQFDAAYKRIGNSFKQARWGKERKVIVAVMRRDEGEALVVQDMTRAVPPYPVVAGDKVEFDIDPRTGEAVFVVSGFRVVDPEQAPKEWIQNGRIVVPFDHMIGKFDPTQLPPRIVPVWIGKGDERSFQQPRLSPDGATLLVQEGPYQGNGRTEVRRLVLMPATEAGARLASVLLDKPVFDSEWHPSGNSVVLCLRNDRGKRAIFVVNKDGSGLRDLTGDAGDFADPSFSPQSK